MTPSEAMRKTLEIYLASYRDRDAAGCASCYCLDGALYSPYAPPVMGRAAIEDIHKEWVVEGDEKKTIDIIDVGGTHTSAWCVARFSEGEGVDEGWSLNVFEQQENGDWLIKVSSLNASDG